MSNTYKKFYTVLKNIGEVIEMPESPLLRDSNAYFTFSPFQDTEDNFKYLNESEKIYIKYQKTIRKLNTLNLTNPLNMNYQVTYALQKYKRENYLNFIINVIQEVRNNFFKNTTDKDIEITYPDALHDYFLNSQCNFQLNEVATIPRYICNLDLPGTHFYIKVRIKFRTGAINIVDFVLVDYDNTNFSSQLDSIWVEDLIDLLSENKRFIFDEKKYINEKNIVSKFTSKSRDQHIVINDVRTILKVMSLGVLPAAKGINSEVKRKIRRLYFYYYFYINKDSNGLCQIITSISKGENYSSEVEEIFIQNIRQIEKNYIQSIKTLKRKKLDRKRAQETLGIPNEYYGDFLSNWHSEYDF